MGRLQFSHGLNIVITTTFVSLLAMPIVGPALPVVQEEFGISNRDIGWVVMSAYTLPALLFVPIFGYLADRFSKKAVLLPTMILFSLCGGAISLAPNTETIIALRFLQGIGASAIATLNIALVPDLFSGRDRLTVMGWTGVVQGIGSGVLPLIGGLLAFLIWYLPFMAALMGLPVSLYIYFYLKNIPPPKKTKKTNYAAHAWKHLADRRVVELCFFTFGYIFVGFGAFVSYIPSFLSSTFGSGPLLIGVIIAARALSGALTASFLNQLTLKFSSRSLVVSSFFVLGLGIVSIPLVTGPLGVIFAAFCYGAGFGVTRPLLQVHLFELAPDDLRATFASANGVALRFAQTLSPLSAGFLISWTNFGTMYLAAGTIAFLMMILAFYGNSLSAENTKMA